jgi:two-component system sensor histidine kinase KdpD
MTEPERPDPDALLRRLQAEEKRSARGTLKVFFGFAPGVGKTYRMLQVAHDLARHGVDVVVGIVETHKRGETMALLEGLQVLPRRKVECRGHVLEELDLEAVLARRPSLVVVDELAHTNVQGSRHSKRWQDAMDLLDAGIDVLTTMNVQHLESLNDVVAQITHVQVQETVPDTVLERADEIELVDVSPEQLLARLKEGKVYLPDQAARAAAHFFQRGSLLALRELALRRTAEHVESDVQEYRQEHGVASSWATSERVLVSVGPAPASVRLVRAARRMAAGLRAPWVAAYVEAAGRPPLRDADRARLETHLRLAQSLGATVVRLSGVDVAGPLLAYARKHNVTKLVIGKPTHSRLLDRVRGSLLDDVVRGSGDDIDVHVISGDVPREEEARGSVPPEHIEHSLTAYIWSAMVVAATTGLAVVVRKVHPMPDLEMLYLVGVMIAASFLGRGPSILAAALSVAAYDFFFVPPYFTFAVRESSYTLTFVMMFVVGFTLSALASRIRRQEHDALVREERSAALYSLSASLGALLEPAAAAAVVTRHAADVFQGGAAVLTPAPDGSLEVIGAFPAETALGPTELGVAKWVHEHGRLAGLGTDTLPGSRALCAQLRVGPEPLGALALFPRDNAALTTDQRAFFEAFCRQAAFAFERVRLSDDANRAAQKAKAEEIRSSLLSAVSHDLRTPLAAITGAATSLRDGGPLATEVRAELLDTVCEEAERLERLVGNLLDMTRLESGGLEPKREWVPADELVGAALSRLEAKLADRRVTTRIDVDVPLLSIDPVLMQQVLVNLLENALKYTPPGSPLELGVSRDGGFVVVDVADHGPGLPADTERLFEKFQRGHHTGIAGVGLGLSICRAIAEAHGGRLNAENRAEGGARFRVRLPTPAGAPPLDQGATA